MNLMDTIACRVSGEKLPKGDCDICVLRDRCPGPISENETHIFPFRPISEADGHNYIEVTLINGKKYVYHDAIFYFQTLIEGEPVMVIDDAKIKARRVIKLSEIESYFVQKNEEEDDGGNSKA